MAVYESSAATPVIDQITKRDRTTVLPNTYGESTYDEGEDFNRGMAEAQAQWDAKYKELQAKVQAVYAKIKGGDLGATKEIDALRAEEAQLNASKPSALDIRQQVDRNRLIQQAAGTYQPLITNLQAQIENPNLSAALAAYRQAADDAARRNYGVAASALGTGGQRAALFQAAMGQEAVDRQRASQLGTQIAADEQAKARQALLAAAGGQAQVYENLLGNTGENERANQNAKIEADRLNKGTASANAAGVSNAVGAGFETAGRLGAGIATGGASEAVIGGSQLVNDAYGGSASGDTTDYITPDPEDKTTVSGRAPRINTLGANS